MLKHILVPLDGSKLAEEALDHALDLLCANGRITLLSTVDVPDVPVYGYYPPATAPDYQATMEDLLPQAKQYLQDVAARLERPDLTIGVEAQIGEPAHVIVEMAEKLAVDAIVMSTHGRSGISRWLFGSVTGKVLSSQPCPVYVVPSKQKKAAPAG